MSKSKDDPSTNLSLAGSPSKIPTCKEKQLKTLNEELGQRLAEVTAQLQQREHEFHLLVSNIPALLSYVDSSQCYRYVNQHYEKLHQLPADAIIGKTVAQLLGPSAYEIVRPHVETALSGNEVSYEGNFNFEDGPHTMQVNYVPDWDSQGNVKGFFSMVIDITKHKVSEEALRESEERLHAIVNTAVEAILTVDHKGLIQSFNPAAEGIFGYSANEVIGANVKVLMPAPHRDEHQGYIERYLKTGEKKIVGIGREVEAKRKDGTIFPIHLSVAETDHLGLFTGVIRDLTEHKKAEKELEKAREELMVQTLFTQRLSALATMAGGIAHELNQPLGSIGLYAETIRNIIRSKETVDTSRISGNLDEILKQVGRASKIIDHMRDFASDSKKERNSEVSVYQVIENVLGLVGQQLRNHCIEFTNDVPKGLKIKIDETRLEQVLVVLISNAKDSIENKVYPPEERGTIRISSKTNKQCSLLKIEDNGAGVHDEVVDKVFEPFVTTKGPDRGMGLGLSICHGILKDYGASIVIEKTGKKGTTFKLTFPKTAD